jgi:hypothetical protein
LRDLDELPGSLGTWAGRDLGLAMVTYELERKGALSRETILRHVRSLVSVLAEDG